MVRVPDVFIVKLFLIIPTAAADQVPVPLKIIAVVPEIVPAPVEFILPVLIVLPVFVIVPPKPNVPDNDRLLLNVIEAPLLKPTLFQIIPLVDKVDVAIFSVLPVVITVPAVYVKVPAYPITPEKVIVPDVLIVKLLFIFNPAANPPLLIVPVPFNT